VEEVARFGRYELVAPLDRGGMGEVYLARARGPERVHKTVVVKRMRPERASDDQARARFADEARVAMSLAHPHIVPVFEFGEIDGEYFLIMEWLRGGNLGRVAGVDREPLPWRACALVGAQIGDALVYVHARANRAGRGLVHGDLTPRNILLSADGHALLADFGLARFAGQGRAGTVRYLAPEQARGESFDARADLYALALVLAEAATGRPVLARDPAQAAREARVGVVPDLTGVDEGLARVLRQALAATPDGRFADAARLRAAFDALLDREPGARAAGRAALLHRVASAGAAQELGGDTTAATRTASRLPRLGRRRWLWALAALPLGIGAAVAWPRRGPTPPIAAPTSAPAAASPGSAPSPTSVSSPTTASSLNAAPSPTAGASALPAASSTGAASPASETSAARAGSPTPVAAPSASPGASSPARHADAHVARHKSATPTPPPASSATLDLNAQPWAHVRIDGVARGETPLLDLPLVAGPHAIELTNEPLGARRELTVTLRPGEHARRIEDLTR
jgi:serine/threonine-protein kinase